MVGPRLRELEWQWIWSQLVLVTLLFTPVFVAKSVYLTVTGHGWGFDYHGGIWHAGRDILAARNPYPPPIPARLLVPGNALITPPLLPVLALPLALIGFHVALALWDGLQAVALVAALRMCGVRDWRGYALAIGSLPFVASIGLGQPDGLFALAAAIAWRYRDRSASGIAVGLLIAAKLVAWPLVIWLLVTRRTRAAAVSLATAGVGILAPFAAVRFHGMSSYPRLLSADATAFEARSQSVTAFLVREGVQQHPARLVAACIVLVMGGALARRARDSDVGLFAVMLVAGLLLSPIMWSHYLVLLVVPLALTHPKPDYAWLAYAAFWVSPTEPPKNTWQIVAVLVLACFLEWRFITVGSDADDGFEGGVALRPVGELP